MEISQKSNFRQNFTALKIDPDMCQKTMEEVVNNIEILNLTKKLHMMGEDLYVREIPANLDLQSNEYISSRTHLLLFNKNGNFKKIGDFLSEKIKEISANDIYDKLIGKNTPPKGQRTLEEKVQEFNQLL